LETTLEHPPFSWPGSSWPLPVPSTEIVIEGTALWWCYWHNLECDGRAEKVFTKLLPRMFQTSLQSLAVFYSCIRRIFWKKCSLNDCTVLCFSEIKWFLNMLQLPRIWTELFNE
jgi:hypothetical protein